MVEEAGITASSSTIPSTGESNGPGLSNGSGCMAGASSASTLSASSSVVSSSAGASLSDRELQWRALSAEFGNTGRPGYRRGFFRTLHNHMVDPRRTFHQYLLLIVLCFFVPGPYFLDSMIGAFKAPIKSRMGLSNGEFGLLFAISSLTGIACGPAGALISVLGRTRWTVAMGFVCAVSSLFTLLCYYWNAFIPMVVARVFFWMSLNGMLLVQQMLVYGIFSTAGVASAYSMVIFAMRCGGVLGYFLSGPMLEHLGDVFSLCAAVAFVFLAFICTIVFACLFRGTEAARAVRRLHPSGQGRAKTFELGMLRLVPRSAQLFVIAIGCLYACVFPFESIAVDMLVEDFGFDPSKAGYLLSVVPALSLSAPLLARFLSRETEGQLKSAVVGLAVTGVGQLILAVQAAWSPYVGFVCVGLGYVTSVCMLWSALPGLVKSTVEQDHVKNVESLILGLGYAMLSIGQFTSNLVAGFINDTASYRYVCIWFAVLAFLGSLFSMASVRMIVPLGHPGAESSSGQHEQRPAELDEQLVPQAKGDATVVVFESSKPLELSRTIEDHYVAS